MVSKFVSIFRTYLYRNSPRMVGISMVFTSDQSIMLLTSSGRLRLRLGTRASALARFILTNCP